MISLFTRVACRVFALPLLALAGAAQTPATSATPAPVPASDLPRIEARTLTGDAHFLWVDVPALERVEGTLVFTAGSVHEPADRAGLVAVLCDALRTGGSMAFTAAELDRWLDFHEASLRVRGGPERIALELSCKPDDLRELLVRVRDLLLAPAYTAESIAASCERVSIQMEHDDEDPAAQAERTLLEQMCGPESPWVRRPRQESLDALEREDLLLFHRASFGLNRLWLALAGPPGADATALLVDEILADLGRTSEAPRVERPFARVANTTRSWVVDRPDGDEVTLCAAIARRGGEAPALALLAEAMRCDGWPMGPLALDRPSAWPAPLMALRASVSPGTTASTLHEWIDGLRDVARRGIGVEPIEAARANLLRSEAEAALAPRAALERALTFALLGDPAQGWASWNERLRTLTVAELDQLGARTFAKPRLDLVAVGPARTLVRLLEEENQRSDAKSGEPPGALLGPVMLLRMQVAPRGTPDGLVLRERMFQALGGIERWVQISTVLLAGEVNVEGTEFPVTVRIVRDLRHRMLRLEQTLSGKKSVQVVTPEAGWSQNEQGLNDLSATMQDHVRYREERQLVQVLHDLAVKADRSVRRSDDGRLEVLRRRELLCWIELGEDARPARLGYPGPAGGPESVYEFRDWSETDGFPWPSLVVQIEAHATFHWAKFEPNFAIEPPVFEK